MCENNLFSEDPMNRNKVEISFLVPFYNEDECVVPLYEKISSAAHQLDKSYEMVFVDDGSSDETFATLKDIAAKDSQVKVVSFRRNFGQTAAILAAIDYSNGDIIVTLDGDLQNDPNDIPKLLEKLDEGYDVVSGWRKNRKDRFLSRILPSKIANWLISKISKVRLHDYGCTLKAYRKNVIKGVRIYGEMHRFIPIFASWEGAKVTEIVVTHHPRTSGSSKYGISRTFKVVLDLIVIQFLAHYGQKPIYVFGGLGIISFFLGFLVGLWAVVLKLFYATSFISTPLPLLTVLLFVLGFNCVFMGLIAEIGVRTYYESQNKTTYVVREELNLSYPQSKSQ